MTAMHVPLTFWQERRRLYRPLLVLRDHADASMATAAVRRCTARTTTIARYRAENVFWKRADLRPVW